MASTAQVKTYLAHWFQLGKKLIWLNGREELLPATVIKGSGFSPEFEDCWQKIMSVGGKDCYLLGSNETVADLLSATWDINGCARCNMPIPILESGTQPLECICSDLDNWPNFELPSPRSPVDSSAKLNSIKERLNSQ